MSGKPTNSAIANALKLQAANVTQRALLDMLTTKVIHTKTVLRISYERSPKVLRGVAADLGEALGEIDRVMKLTREETKELRAQQVDEYPDEEIQQIISDAADKIVDILLRDNTLPKPDVLPER